MVVSKNSFKYESKTKLRTIISQENVFVMSHDNKSQAAAFSRVSVLRLDT